MSWTEQADQTLQMLLENMVAEAKLARRVGLDPTPAQVVNASRDMLLDVIRTSLPLAQIMDTSDLVLHAEGPAVREHALKLSAVNWLTQTAESVIRKLSGSMFDLASLDARRLGRALDLRLTGFAPGSLYAGIAIEPPSGDLLSPMDIVDEPVIQQIRMAVRNLPDVPHLIGDEGISPEVRNLLPDPAQRDTTLTALYKLSPTGRRGIHTVDIASPGKRSAGLSQRERVVLKDAVEKPKLHDRKSGRFTGELREIDLDAHRFHLRDIENIGSLRCIVGDLDSVAAKRLLGEFVQVDGEYETDQNGRPRLMIVHSVTLRQRAHQSQFSDL